MTRTSLFGRAALLFAVAGCRPVAAPVPDPPELDPLFALVGQRLGLMHDVAHAKWANKSPISDPEREGQFLAAMAEAGRGHGLDPAVTRWFFAAQIEAAKLVQRADHDRWGRDGPPAGPAPDLKATVRPAIDRVSRELLPALAAATRTPPPADAVRRAAARHLAAVPADARDAAAAPLLGR